MLMRAHKFASALRECPVCRSRAVSRMRTDDVDDYEVCLSLRCGECGTWRSAVHETPRARAVEGRLCRRLKGDRRDIEFALRRLELAGIDPDDLPAARKNRPVHH